MAWMDSLNAASEGKKGLGDEERKRIARDLVSMSSFGAAVVTYVPVPLTDFLLVTPVQGSMVMSLGRLYGRKMDMTEARRIVFELGAVCGVALAAQKGFATLTKLLLPGLGGLLSGPYAFAVTYGLGNVATHYFASRDAPAEVLKGIYDDAVREGRRLFSREKLEEFRKRQGAEVTDFARKNAKQQKVAKERPSTRAKRGGQRARKKPAPPARPARPRTPGKG